MSKKDEKIEKFVRDAESKAESLYRAGYKDGYNSGYIDGYDRAIFDERFPKYEPIFEIGDEVTDENGLKAVVTNNDMHIHLLYENGKTWKVPHDLEYMLKKTGIKARTVIERDMPW